MTSPLDLARVAAEQIAAVPFSDPSRVRSIAAATAMAIAESLGDAEAIDACAILDDAVTEWETRLSTVRTGPIRLLRVEDLDDSEVTR